MSNLRGDRSWQLAGRPGALSDQPGGIRGAEGPEPEICIGGAGTKTSELGAGLMARLSALLPASSAELQAASVSHAGPAGVGWNAGVIDRAFAVRFFGLSLVPSPKAHHQTRQNPVVLHRANN